MEPAAEADLHRSEAALSALIENANDAIWSIDRTYRLTAFNSIVGQRFAALFGAPLRADTAYDDGRVRAHWRTHWRPFYDRGLAGERFNVEHSLEMPDGVRHFATFFNPIVTDGAVSGLAIFSSDITERKRAEEAARQHQAELTHVLRLSTMGEMAERVFDPFFSTKPGGLGMGLSISRRIIEMHHGRLSVAPNTDGGVTFRVTLPISPAPLGVAAAG